MKVGVIWKSKWRGEWWNEKEQMTLWGMSASPRHTSPWWHSPTACLPIKTLIKADKVSPNEERAVGGLNCRSLSVTLPEESGEGRAKGYGHNLKSGAIRPLPSNSVALHACAEKRMWSIILRVKFKVGFLSFFCRIPLLRRSFRAMLRFKKYIATLKKILKAIKLWE